MAYPTKENHEINRYNGHTWIVAITGMIGIFLITLAGFGILGFTVWLTSQINGDVKEMGEVFEVVGGIPAITFGCYKTTVGLFSHLTTPKEVKHE